MLNLKIINSNLLLKIKILIHESTQKQAEQHCPNAY